MSERSELSRFGSIMVFAVCRRGSVQEVLRTHQGLFLTSFTGKTPPKMPCVAGKTGDARLSPSPYERSFTGKTYDASAQIWLNHMPMTDPDSAARVALRRQIFFGQSLAGAFRWWQVRESRSTRRRSFTGKTLWWVDDAAYRASSASPAGPFVIAPES